jgi:hypothetical protein
VIDHDESTYILGGQTIYDGGQLYKDVIDAKPPGIFIIYYLNTFLFNDLIFGSRVIGWIAVSLTATLLCLFMKNLLSFLKLHLDPHPENLHILDETGLKTVVLIRDTRDMLISRYYHVINDKNHWDYQRLKFFSSQSRLLESMKAIDPEGSISVIEYYNYWINGWLKNNKISS